MVQVETTYQERFGGLSQKVSLESYPAPSEFANNRDLCIPICHAEVCYAIHGKYVKSSPGPDKLTLGTIRKIDDHEKILTNLFNTWYIAGKIPSETKR
jgi:hypothetical protein